MQRQMIGVLRSNDLRQQPGARQALVDDGDRHRRRRDMIMTLRTGVLETHVLPDKQTGGLVIELFADVFAELLADFPAAGTQTLRFGHKVLLTAPRQLLGQRFAAMARARWLGAGGWLRGGLRGRSGTAGSAAPASSGSSQGWLGSKRSAMGPYKRRSS